MSASQDRPFVDATPPEVFDGPGRRLRAVREARGMDIDRVAAQLHLRREVVDALEQDRYQDLPAPVFVAGYLRNYARLLGEPADPLVQAYRATVTDPAAELQPAPNAAPRTGRAGGIAGMLLSLLGLVLLGALLGGGALWWQSQMDGKSTGNETAQPATEAAPAETEAAADGGAVPAATGTGDRTPPAEAIPLRSLEPAVPTEPATPPTAPGEAAPPPASVADDALIAAAQPGAAETAETSATPPTVALEFTGTSWVDVRDAKGKVVLNGEMREGDRRTLEGEPPYQFVIGNAAATKVSVGAEPFDLGQHSRGNVARFTLDPRP